MINTTIKINSKRNIILEQINFILTNQQIQTFYTNNVNHSHNF